MKGRGPSPTDGFPPRSGAPEFSPLGDQVLERDFAVRGLEDALDIFCRQRVLPVEEAREPGAGYPAISRDVCRRLAMEGHVFRESHGSRVTTHA